MDYSIVITAFQLVFYLSLPVLAAALGGALVAGVLQVATQIEDQLIGFVGKFAAVVLLLFFATAYFSNEVLGFTQRVWGGADFYQ